MTALTPTERAGLNALARSAPWAAQQANPGDYALGCIVRDFCAALGCDVDDMPCHVRELADDAYAFDRKAEEREFAEESASRRMDAR